MHLRQLCRQDAERAAEFLDSRTLTLRWLVAFFRHLELLPEEQESSWALWCGTRTPAASPEEVAPGERPFCCVLVHFFPTATLYVCGDPDTDLAVVEDLCREELLPERIVGDRDCLERWRAASPGLFERSLRVSELEVLAYAGTDEPPPDGLRRALPADLPLVEEFDRLLAVELEEEPGADLEPLVEAGLIHVFQEEGRVKGTIRSNFPDGRYVHGGGVFVHPLYRGHGIGVLLSRGLGAIVRKELGLAVVLDVYQDNPRALAVYRKAGYEPLGRGLELRLAEDAWKD